MRACLTFLLLIGVCFILRAQPFEKYVYQYPKQIPQQYAFDPLIEYENILANLDREAKQSAKERYAEMVAFGKSRNFEKGIAYMGWDKAEEYVNDVLKNLMKADNLIRPEVHVYLNRSADLNAFTRPDGSIFLNVGLLAELTDEAALASLLGHELSHYLNKDSENYFFDNLKSFNKKNRNKLRVHTEMAHDNQKIENRSDLYGWETCLKAGYHLESSMSMLYTMMVNTEIKESWNRKLGTQGSTRLNRMQQLLASHPETKERIDSLTAFMDKFPKSVSGSRAIVNAETFEYLKYQSRLQVLDILLKANLNGFCMKKAISYILLSDNDPYLAHYCIEGLRRYIYFNPELFSEPILSDYFPSMPEVESWDDLLIIMLRSPKLIEQAQNSPLVLKYKNPQSHELFVSIMEEVIKEYDYAEGYLSLALLEKSRKSEPRYNRFLDLYIAHPQANFKDYANHLKSESLYDGLGSTNYFLLDEIDLIEDHYYGLHHRAILSRQLNSEIMEEAQKTLQSNDIGNEKILSLTALKREDLNQFIDLKSIVQFASFYETKFLDANPHLKNEVSDEIIFKKPSEPAKSKEPGSEPYTTNIFEYSPENWKLYKQYKVDHLSVAYGEAVDRRDNITNALLLCCFPTQYLCARIRGHSQRYYFNVAYLTVDVHKPSYDHLSDRRNKKFSPKVYFSELKELIELAEQ